MKFHVLVPHLDEVIGGTVFSAKQREKAGWIKSNVTDERFVSLLALEIDVLSVVTVQSLSYQKVGGTIIGDYSRYGWSQSLGFLRLGRTSAVQFKPAQCWGTIFHTQTWLK